MSHITRTVTGAAVATTVVGSMTNASPGAGGTFSIASGTGWPTGTFAVLVDYGLATQETILCSARSGTTITVATSGRGYDGSTAQAHLAGATIEHVFDFVALTALFEHVNTDAGHDHSGYLSTANFGLVGDIAKQVPGQAAAAGASGRYADAAHVHPIDAIPSFRCHQNTAVAVLDSTMTVLQMDTTDRDTHGAVQGLSTAAFRYVIPSGWDGVWEFSMGIEYTANAAGYRQATFRKNGVGTDLAGTRSMAATTGGIATVVTTTVLLHGLSANAGDYVQPFAYQTSGGLLNVPPSAAPLTFFAGRWVRA